MIISVFGFCTMYFYKQSSLEFIENKKLQEDINQQLSFVATQSFLFEQFNKIAFSYEQYTLSSDIKSQEKENEYRNILKKEPICNAVIPDAISGRLLDYAYRLRSQTNYADTIKFNRSSTGHITSLTYCEAIIWIDSLLKIIDQANNKLQNIRKIELLRMSLNNPPHTQ